MNPLLRQLISLQKIDDELAELRKGQAQIPGQIESARSAMNEKKQFFDGARKEIEDLQKERKQLEMDVQSENDHMAKAKIKLPNIKTNKEYTAILAEVDAIKEKVSGIEDKEIEIMETLEEKEKTIPGVEAQVKEEEKQFEEYKARKDQEAERIKKEIESAEAKREQLVGTIEMKWLQSYEKITKLRGQAVVLLTGDICQGCFQQVLPQMVIEVKNSADKIHRCLHCSRILYWMEESETVPPATQAAGPRPGKIG